MLVKALAVVRVGLSRLVIDVVVEMPVLRIQSKYTYSVLAQLKHQPHS